MRVRQMRELIAWERATIARLDCLLLQVNNRLCRVEEALVQAGRLCPLRESGVDEPDGKRRNTQTRAQ